jgi:microcompartment protein CcmK/EutM
MLKATVIGSVWATRRLDGIPRGAFLEVAPDGGSPLVAFDVLGSGLGERVLIATGSVASGFLGPEHPPIDALIIGSLDASSEQEGGEPGSEHTGKSKET